MPTLVYLITGFLESGKTSLIKRSLEDPEFSADNNKTLIIQFEEGLEEFEKDWLEKYRSDLVVLESFKDLTSKKMEDLSKTYKPDQVFIEFNGLEPVGEFLDVKMTNDWVLVQILTTINAQTFTSYMNNMRSYMYEIIRFTQTIVFNRVNSNISKLQLRNNIKAVNRNAQIVYLNMDNEPESFGINDLPFDVTSNLIDISNDDYGLWYMDALEDPGRYNEKNILLRGMYLESIEGYKHSFIMGRYSMVCCANDMQAIGITVTGVDIKQMKLNDWYEVEGTLKTIDRGDGQDTLVLYAKSIKTYPRPEYELVDFN